VTNVSICSSSSCSFKFRFDNARYYWPTTTSSPSTDDSSISPTTSDASSPVFSSAWFSNQKGLGIVIGIVVCLAVIVVIAAIGLLVICLVRRRRRAAIAKEGTDLDKVTAQAALGSTVTAIPAIPKSDQQSPADVIAAHEKIKSVPQKSFEMKTGVQKSPIMKTGVQKSPIMKTGVQKSLIMKTGVQKSAKLKTAQEGEKSINLPKRPPKNQREKEIDAGLHVCGKNECPTLEGIPDEFSEEEKKSGVDAPKSLKNKEKK